MSTKQKLIFTADLHADDQIWAGKPQIQGDLRYALWQLEQLINEGDRIIIGGDAFDSKRSTRDAVALLQGFAERVYKLGALVGYVQGNHDPADWLLTSSAAADYVSDLTQTRWETPRGPLLGCHYKVRSEFQKFLSNIPEDIRVLVCHQRFREGFGLEGYHAALDDVPEHVKLVLVGDIHQQVYATNGRCELYYPGCPYFRRINDPLKFGVVVMDAAGAITQHPLDSRSVVKLSVSTKEEVEAAIAHGLKLREEASQRLPGQFVKDLATPIFVVKVFVSAVPELPGFVQKAFSSCGLHLFDVVVPESLAVNATAADIAAHTDLQFLNLELSEEKEPLAHAAFKSLLSGSPFSMVMSVLANQCGVKE